MTILYDKRPDGVAWVTLNRPQVLNALDVQSKERLGEVWREVAADPEVRAVVLSGAGERAFCAGSDIKEINRTGRMVSTPVLLDAIPNVGVRLDKPVIAALHGYCMGMGLTLALHCDLRIAAADTQLGFPEVKHGMISAVSAVHLPLLLGHARALEMLLLGETMTAVQAERIGLVSRVAEGDVRAAADEWARKMAGYAPAAVQATKRAAMFAFGDLEEKRRHIEAARAAVEADRPYAAAAAAFAGKE
jgi:enoyl-CoA hydratase/carnithine racemase